MKRPGKTSRFKKLKPACFQAVLDNLPAQAEEMDPPAFWCRQPVRDERYRDLLDGAFMLEPAPESDDLTQ